MNNKPFWLFTFSTLCLGACISVQPPQILKSTRSVQIKNLNPNFRLILDKVHLDLAKSSHLIILTLLTPDCSSCGQTVQQLNSIQTDQWQTKVKVYGACITSNGCMWLKDFNSAYRPQFPIGITEPTYTPLNRRTNIPFDPISAVPITYLMRGDGTLIESFIGSIPLQYVIKQIENLSSNDEEKMR